MPKATSRKTTTEPQVHPDYWTVSDHYGDRGQCGQSCGCCRSQIEGPNGFGACPVCDEQTLKQQQQ